VAVTAALHLMNVQSSRL